MKQICVNAELSYDDAELVLTEVQTNDNIVYSFMNADDKESVRERELYFVIADISESRLKGIVQSTFIKNSIEKPFKICLN
jgi:hypothetical protein